ncbi:hypothetical protein ACFX1W_024910 [Malus domestica]
MTLPSNSRKTDTFLENQESYEYLDRRNKPDRINTPKHLITKITGITPDSKRSSNPIKTFLQNQKSPAEAQSPVKEITSAEEQPSGSEMAAIRFQL